MSRIGVALAGVWLLAIGGMVGSAATRLLDSERAEYALGQMREMVATSAELGASAQMVLDNSAKRDRAAGKLFAADAELKRANDDVMAQNRRLMLACLR